MPLITNDAIAFGLLMITLAGIFTTANSSHPFWKKLYTFVPSLLLCYFIPSIYSTLGWIDPSSSQLYYVASRYLLPASLVLLTLSIDLKAVLGLGWKAIAMFLTGTIGIVIGGPLAMLIVGALDPSILEASSPDNEIWRGLATVAGSWIGGGANQTAMLEVYQPSSSLFSAMVTVDIIMANLWLAFLLYGASMATKVDQWLGSDTSAITHLREQVQDYQDKIKRIPSLSDLMSILAVAFGITAIGTHHW
jgi:uncharacterized membrane protein